MPGRDEARFHTDFPHLQIGQRLFPELLGLNQIIGKLKGIVDQNIELALLAPHLIEQRCDLFVFAVIAGDRDAFAAGLLAACCAFRRSLADRARKVIFPRRHRAPRHIDRRALLREHQRDASPDAATGAGDDCDLSCQRCHNLLSGLCEFLLPLGLHCAKVKASRRIRERTHVRQIDLRLPLRLPQSAAVASRLGGALCRADRFCRVERGPGL